MVPGLFPSPQEQLKVTSPPPKKTRGMSVMGPFGGHHCLPLYFLGQMCSHVTGKEMLHTHHLPVHSKGHTPLTGGQELVLKIDTSDPQYREIQPADSSFKC